MANNRIVIRYFIGAAFALGRGSLHAERPLREIRRIRLTRSTEIPPNTAKGYPPAIAPMMKNGSMPFAIGSGRGVSGGSWEMSSPHAKNRSEEHTSELQSRFDLVCRLLLEKKKKLSEMQKRTICSG